MLHPSASFAEVDFDSLPVVQRRPQVASRSLQRKHELQVSVRFHFAGHDVPYMTMSCMVDSRNQVIVVAGFEVFPNKLHVGAPRRLCLKGVEQNSSLAGGAVGVNVDYMELAVLNIDGLQLFQCAEVFIYLADVGPRAIIGFPFVIRYNLPLVPQFEYLVPGEVLNKYLSFVSGLEEDVSCALCRPSHPCVHHFFALRLQNSFEDWRHGVGRIRSQMRRKRPNSVKVCHSGVVCTLRAEPLTLSRVRARIRDSITGNSYGDVQCSHSEPEPSDSLSQSQPGVSCILSRSQPVTAEHSSAEGFVLFMFFSMLAGCSTTTPQPENQLCYKKLISSASARIRGSPAAAGLDLCSATALELQPGEIAVVPTDLAFTVPACTYGRIAPRSGFASKGTVV